MSTKLKYLTLHNLEWQRTNPDITVYLPDTEFGADTENQHFLVTKTKSGAWLAVWTMASYENHKDQRVVISRSIDKGVSWTKPEVIDGQSHGDEQRASWGFPMVVPQSGRIYVFYNKNIGITDAREDTTGVCRFRYSDDDGLTWSADTYDVPISDAAIDHPDSTQPKNWIVFQPPVIYSDGKVIAGFTRWSSRSYNPTPDLFQADSEIFFLRFDNILTESDPAELIITTLPQGERGIRVMRDDMPTVSVAQEPTVVELSDGRWVCVMRTLNGNIGMSISTDGGCAWSESKPLRNGPEGEELKNPICSCPLYKLKDGRYLLVFYNNDGSANGGSGPADYQKNRWPAYFTIGRETGDTEQPLRFGEPKEFATSNGVIIGPSQRTEVASYPSLVEDGDMRVFFYPDRKHFLLGRYLTDKWLRECDPDNEK